MRRLHARRTLVPRERNTSPVPDRPGDAALNSIERMRAVLSGQLPDRTPNFNILTTFSVRLIGEPLPSFYTDFRVLCEANLAMLDEIGTDIVQAASDPFREAFDYGAEIDFPEDGAPVCKRPLINDPSDIQHLRRMSPASGRRGSDRLEALRFFRESVGGEVPIMGWVEGVLSVAGILRGPDRLLADLTERPDWAGQFLDFLVRGQAAFARAQVEAGADLVCVGDGLSSRIPSDLYRRFVLPRECRIFDALHEAGALGRLHVCGDTTPLLRDLAVSGADIIDLDGSVSLKEARRTLGPSAVLCGNIDPVTVILKGKPADVRKAVQETLKDGGRAFISAAGCEIPEGSPPANLRSQAETLGWNPGQ
jgi:MtaA/CmuA family methyltransferase